MKSAFFLLPAFCALFISSLGAAATPAQNDARYSKLVEIAEEINAVNVSSGSPHGSAKVEGTDEGCDFIITLPGTVDSAAIPDISADNLKVEFLKEMTADPEMRSLLEILAKENVNLVVRINGTTGNKLDTTILPQEIRKSLK